MCTWNQRFVRALVALLLLLGLSSAAWAGGVPIEQATDEQKAAATKAYKDGRTSFDERRFVDALQSFRESYGVVSSPNTHLMIAHTLRELGRNAEAYDTFGAVAEQALEAAKSDPRYEASAELALKEQSLLRDKIGLVTLEIVAPAASAKLSVEGRVIDRSRWQKPIAVDPGQATFLLTTEGDPVVRELEVTAGGEHRLRIDAKAPPPSPPPPPPPPGDDTIDWLSTWRIVAYGVAGAGVLSFAVAGGLGGAALSKHNELEDACGGLPCPERQDDIDAGRRFQTASNAMLIVGAGLVAAGVALWFVAPTIEGEGEAEASVGLGVHPGGLSIMGRFR